MEQWRSIRGYEDLQAGLSQMPTVTGSLTPAEMKRLFGPPKL
jgi:hypothetical protein